MILVVSSHKPAQARRRTYPNGMLPTGTAGNWITGYMGREFRDPTKPVKDPVLPSPDQIYPMAYLVEQDANTTLRAHFHIVDQFQVFVAGAGHLGTVAADNVSFQFSSPYSAYGPIKAGPSGIHYITLRNRYDPGSRFMPEARNELPPPPRNYRRVFRGPLHPLAAVDLAALTQSVCSQLIGPEPDGLGAWHYRLPPGQAINGPNPGTGEGQHWVVLGGHLDCGMELAGINSCIFVSPDEAAFSAQAGRDGLEILVFQYPIRSKH